MKRAPDSVSENRDGIGTTRKRICSKCKNLESSTTSTVLTYLKDVNWKHLELLRLHREARLHLQQVKLLISQ